MRSSPNSSRFSRTTWPAATARRRLPPGSGDVSYAHLVAGLDSTLRERPLLAIPLLFGAGLATSLTPCVYPMIPITAGVLSGLGTRQATRGRAGVLTLAYPAGLGLVYSLLGLLAGLTGTLFGSVSSSPWASFVTANLLLVFGLALLDVFSVSAPA